MNPINHRYAFPSDAVIRKAEDGSILEREPGMTLLDWFAGQALAGLFADATFNPEIGWSDVSRAAYEVADAMMAERERRGIK